MSVLHAWGYKPEDSLAGTVPTAVPKRRPRKAKADSRARPKLPTWKIVGIYKRKGLQTALETSEEFNVHRSTVTSIWRKAVHARLLDRIDRSECAFDQQDDQ